MFILSHFSPHPSLGIFSDEISFFFPFFLIFRKVPLFTAQDRSFILILLIAYSNQICGIQSLKICLFISDCLRSYMAFQTFFFCLWLAVFSVKRDVSLLLLSLMYLLFCQSFNIGFFSFFCDGFKNHALIIFLYIFTYNIMFMNFLLNSIIAACTATDNKCCQGRQRIGLLMYICFFSQTLELLMFVGCKM